MLGKRARAYDRSELPPGQRLRHNIADLFSSNAVSGIRAQELFNDAAAAGDEACAPLRSRGHGGHEARDLRRRLLNTHFVARVLQGDVQDVEQAAAHSGDHDDQLLTPARNHGLDFSCERCRQGV